MSDIEQRLRDRHGYAQVRHIAASGNAMFFTPSDADMMREAADTIHSLRARLAQAEKERDRLYRLLDTERDAYGTTTDRLIDERDTSLADVAETRSRLAQAEKVVAAARAYRKEHRCAAPKCVDGFDLDSALAALKDKAE